jgi:hypothetical protein
MIGNFDPEQFKLKDPPTGWPKKKTPRWCYQTKKGESFLRGPIPLWWLNRAGRLPGRGLQVAIRLWFLVGVTYSLEVRLNQSKLLDIGLGRDSARRGLAALESNGLISVVRHSGRKPIVTIILSEGVAHEGA